VNSDQLLDAIRDKVDHPATARDLLQRLKIPREQRPIVKRLLEELVESGHLIQTRGNHFGLPDRMNLVVGRVQTHPRGFGFVIADKPVDGVSGDIFIAGANLNQAMHGDRVVARIERTQGDRAEGGIIRILERGSSTIVGRFDVDESAAGYLVPFDRRLIMDVQILPEERHDAKPGEMVVAEITRWPTPTRPALGRVLEVLGDIEEPGVDTEIIIRKFGITDQRDAQSRRRSVSAPR
jgi:ribonuclease R